MNLSIVALLFDSALYCVTILERNESHTNQSTG